MELSVGFANKTDRVWTMGIYQTLPLSVGLDSVAWKRSSAPRGGRTGVRWNVTFNVALAEYFQQGGIGVYEANQTLDTTLGKQWKIVVEQGVQQLVEDGSALLPDQLIIKNGSQQFANPGIGMDGNGSVFQRNIPSGSQADFLVRPTYWAALFNSVILGEVISSAVTIQPLQIRFAGGITHIALEAWMEGNTLHFGEPQKNFFSLSMDVVNALEAERQEIEADRQRLLASGRFAA